jgi:DNA-binding transcriptional MerR regulator
MAVDDDKTRYTASTLGALCGVSARTVRYYVEEGLLPPPSGRGRGANFEDDHVTRLRLIRAMQQAGNDLDTIREYLRELESELRSRGATFEGALAVWSGRDERAAWAEQMRSTWTAPMPLHRYRVAEGVELLIDATVAPAPARMREILTLLREAMQAPE